MIKIGTHDGRFHTDEVFGVAALLMAHPRASYVRTRNEGQLVPCNYLVDVGREYDPDRGRYDHHQPGGAGVRPNGIQYSSFGLVWRHHGHLLADNEDVRALVDEILVQSVDARDNGQQLSTPNPEFGGAMPFELATLINFLNPHWDEEAYGNGAFERALQLAEMVLRRVISYAESTVRARTVVRQAIKAEQDPRIIVLERGCPWQDVVLDEAPDALFVVLGGGDEWIVQCVPRERGSKQNRRSLPEAWGGMDRAAFADATGVADAVFVHKGLFICGARSREGALALAQLALG